MPCTTRAASNRSNDGASAGYSTTNDLNHGRRMGLEWSNTLRLPGFGPAGPGPGVAAEAARRGPRLS